MTPIQARTNIENPDATAAQLFPLTTKRKFSERVQSQIRAAKFQHDIACDKHSAQVWKEVEGIYRFLCVSWGL